MTRQEFIKMCSLLGISIPFQSVLAACKSNNINSETTFEGKVLIIGAGAAGLTAGYLLNQKGIEFQILEASSVYGGRMKINTEFVDFPIPLGAEWLHVERGIFDEIINNSSVQNTIETTPYDPDNDYALFEGQQVSLGDLGFDIDQKFINASWYDFFAQYIVPSIQDKIIFNQLVDTINYSDENILVTTENEEFTADKVIITTPVKLLQNGLISFTPQLPENKLNAINNVTVWDGFKAFIEFSEKFYPAAVGFNIIPESAGQKLYYDASYGQNSDRHILGLFTVGTGTLPYRNLSDSELIDYMLEELDGIFNNQASSNYIKHISQNWNNEPFAKGAYVSDQEDWRRIRTLGESVDNKLFFAGTVYTTGEDWSSVHTAARSAIRTINEIT
ncbi:flavin monoamine oxidase family protein [Winogradskyella haliclonae]|uniref:Tryptophan 2-monooxygenase n=1 Tax=Winogradskyella haliclonae TaxID=2048558 RepID=A0ABQ2BYY5_9FLAO|nr:FAD-dependent oxidoreductase [Winogradskyella haliclonae]GGI57722.1 amine oxidase [Winogradskyella haliclonae]